MPVSEEVFAALDYGTGGGKCVLFDADGRCLAAAREAWTYRAEPSPDGLIRGFSFDPDVFWVMLARCAERALAEGGVSPGRVRGISTTAQRLGTVMLDAQGREIFAGPNMDGRGFDGALEVISALGLERTVAITGHWPPFVSSLGRYQSFRKQSAGAAIDAVLTLSDWLTYRLTGERVSEASNAGESLFLDVGTRSWSREILAALDVPERILPPLVEPGTRIGGVTEAAARATGFLVGTPVFCGGADTQSALLGSNVAAPGQAAVVLGTTTPVMAVTARPEIDPSARLWTGCHVVPDRWTLESNAGDTGIGYQWLVELLGLDGEAGFARAEAEMAALSPAPAPVFTVAGPNVFDLMSFNPNQVNGILFRMPTFVQRPTRAEILRAYQENVAFAVRANLEQIEAFRGAPVDSVTFSGGMTRSLSLLRILASTVRRPLRVSEEPNATPLGGAVLAAAGIGTYGSIAAAAAAMVRHRSLVDAGADEVAASESQFTAWRALYDQLRATSI